MMLGLVGNISLNGVQVGETHGKPAVPCLPGEVAFGRKRFMNPLRRVALDGSNGVGQGTQSVFVLKSSSDTRRPSALAAFSSINHRLRNLFGRRYQKMNMVGHPTGGQQTASIGPNNPTQVFIETCLKIVCDGRLPFFSAEDNVHMQRNE